MFVRRLALPLCLLVLACADTDDIDTGLKRDPPRGAVRVVSLLAGNPIDFTVTVEDEAPVAFADLEVGVTAWRRQVAGEATGWVMSVGTPIASAPLTLGEGAQVSGVLTAGDPTPRMTWLVEALPAVEAGPHVRFINGLEATAVTVSVDGLALGGQLDPATITAWLAVDETGQVEVVIEDAASTHTYGPVALADETFTTLAAFPGASEEAPPRLLVFHDTAENAVPVPVVLEARMAP